MITLLNMLKLTIDNMEELRNIIIDNISKFEGIKPDNIEIIDLFYFSGLKKWTTKLEFLKNNIKYYARIDISEDGKITRYQQVSK